MIKQKVIAELIIPSRRTLNNGFCADRSQNWIFSENNDSATIEFRVSKYVK